MMTGTRLTYLRNIGIDVWTLRENVVSARQSQEPDRGAEQDANKNVNQAVSQVNTTGAPALRALSAQLREAAGEQDLSAGTSGGAKMSSSTAPEALTTTLVNGNQKPVVDPSPEFLFCFMDYVPEQGDGVTLVFCLPFEAQSLPMETRQFGDDIARGLFGQPLRPDIGELRWPMVKSAHIAQTELEAKTVVIDRVGRCQKNLILFGSTVQHYVIGDAESLMGSKRVYRALSKEVYCSGENSTVETIGQHKQQLWRLLKEVQKFL